jgi:hypothetical protein
VPDAAPKALLHRPRPRRDEQRVNPLRLR